MMATRKTILAAALLASLVPACSTAPGPATGERAVFRIDMIGVDEHGPDPFGKVADVQVPEIYNQSSSTVRMTSVRLLDPPKGLRVVSETAYLWAPIGVPQTFGAAGDLPKECPKEYVPHPVTAAITPPHAYSDWIVVLALQFAKPGRYYLGRVRISYLDDGKPGWQYQNMHITIYEIRGFNNGTGC
jgi:hypothetical protein